MSTCDRDRTISPKLRTAALGQVAGGIVHDANNALAVAVWNIERAARAIEPGTNEAASARTAVESVMRAAGLLRRLLDFADHAAYDPSLVDMRTLLARLFPATSTGGETIRYEPGAAIGPAFADEMLLELTLLDMVASLAPLAGTDPIVIRVEEQGKAETSPDDAEIVVSLDCPGFSEPDLSQVEFALARHAAELAGGRLAVVARGNDRGEVRLHLPRGRSSANDGVVVA